MNYASAIKGSMTLTFDKETIFNMVMANTCALLSSTPTIAEHIQTIEMTPEHYDIFEEMYSYAVSDVILVLSHLTVSHEDTEDTTTLSLTPSAEIQATQLPLVIKKYIVKCVEKLWYEHLGHSVKIDTEMLKGEIKSLALKTDIRNKRKYSL